MAEQSRDTQAYWQQQEDAARFSLHVGGEHKANVNRDQHTASIGTHSEDLKPIAIPHSREIFAEVEKRLGIPTVHEFRGLDRTMVTSPREDSAKQAHEFSRHVKPAKESEHYVRKSMQRLSDLESSRLSEPGKTAIEALRNTLGDLARHDGKWSDASNRYFRQAASALNRLPPDADRLERLARLDTDKAHATLHQVSTVREQDKDADRDKHAGKTKDDPGRER